MQQQNIRNFCIIAHIDHGKSTLADRLLEVTGTVDKREMKSQLLDQMDLEREKGITIKLQPVRMSYKDFQLNLIDTPGHVDFSYEVSRSLAACEGALLVVDSTQGIQAQTLANVYLAMGADLKIIPVINKIDLPAANPEKVSREIQALLDCKDEDILKISAKTGVGIEEVLETVVAKVPPPKGQADKPLRALVFDSYYDDYRGVVLDVRVIDGQLKHDEAITMMATSANGRAREIGFLTPKSSKTPTLNVGEIGYVVTDFKSVSDAKVGDTLTAASMIAEEALAGYENIKPFVYAGLFPSSADDYPLLADAISKLALNDAALTYEPENSTVLGFGFRVGFLGLLHMDIVKERLERDYNLELIITSPSTDYKVNLLNGETEHIRSASELVDMSRVDSIEEPWIKGEVVVPKKFLGAVITLIAGTRGRQTSIDYIDDELSIVYFEAPLANMLTDFFDALKGATSGYGSYSYELSGYRVEDLVRLDFLVSSERVDSLSTIVHKSEAEKLGRTTVKKLKDLIPKQMFKVSLQAAIGARIIAREDIPALKKNVTAHLYGGDVSRKKKLWAKQKRGKERMKKFGNVEIPPEAFTALIKRD